MKRPKPYPRCPPPKFAALLVDPEARSARVVYLRANLTNLRALLGPSARLLGRGIGYHLYGRPQEDTTHLRAILAGCPVPCSGKLLIADPNYRHLSTFVIDRLFSRLTFARGA